MRYENNVVSNYTWGTIRRTWASFIHKSTVESATRGTIWRRRLFSSRDRREIEDTLWMTSRWWRRRQAERRPGVSRDRPTKSPRGPLARNSGKSHRCRLAGGRLWEGEEDGLDLFFFRRTEKVGGETKRRGGDGDVTVRPCGESANSSFIESPWRLHPFNVSSWVRRRSRAREINYYCKISKQRTS